MSKQAQKEGDTDLVRLWEDHMRHEFETRSTDDTLDTMVEDAYVDHVPVLTGGSGKAELRDFYATHFIPRMPPDMEMVPISRTIGRDQLVDEMVISLLTASKWTGCYRVSRRLACGWRSRWS